MEETFSQIEGAAQHSIPDVDVSITAGGSIIGQGVSVSAGAIQICGGNIDNILRSFGGVEGGDTTFGGKASQVVKKTSSYGSKLSNHLENKLNQVHESASDLESFASMAKSVLDTASTEETRSVLEEIVSRIDTTARTIRGVVDKEIHAPKQRASDFVDRNGQFIRAIKSLGANLNEQSKAGILSLTFSSVNELKKLGKEVSAALKTVDMKKKDYLSTSFSQLDSQLTKKLSTVSNKESVSKLKDFLKAWATLMNNHGHRSEIKEMIGGASATSKLVDRLSESRIELKNMVNKFIDAFGGNINGIVSASDEIAKDMGKAIDYGQSTTDFLDTFARLSEYLNGNVGMIYQHLLELNIDQVDSKEFKDRFLSSMRVLSERTDDLGSQSSAKKFAQHCRDVISTVSKFNDMIKTHRDSVKKEGGSTETMNELFSVDASKIDISGLINPLENLKIAIKKIKFFRNIAIFRSNLQQTNKELAVYSKDYSKSVGKAIGEAITKIKNEYTEIINQISDNKAGMGLEIDMYNESLPNTQKISKEKLKLIYKWQCDARIGLYKTVEAIDLYLLHFTETVTKNPDAVADLHKMLSATKIIAKWYDAKAGDNLVRMFESFREPAVDNIDTDAFAQAYAGDDIFADLNKKIGGERANKVFERCRKAVEGVVVLKNIISYFISIGEKYGDFKSEKNIYMAPSNIYKNLVNYIWVSALDVNTVGQEVLTDNNETKRLLSYEDTKVRVAMISDAVNPETMGINFNKHAIDKLRILKCHNELLRLKDFTASMTNADINRVKQFVAGVFARLGKTKYIFEMLSFGIYDLSQMDKPMIKQLFQYIKQKASNTYTITVSDSRIFNVQSEAEIENISEYISQLTATQRSEIVLTLTKTGVVQPFIPLSEFLKSTSGITQLVSMNGATSNADIPKAQTGFLNGFLEGISGNKDSLSSVTNSHRIIAALHFSIMNMLHEYNREHSSSTFAIDDTYFILTIKAIAGKIMAVTGVNSIFKRPGTDRTTINNQTRLIMGGADGDVDVIDEAVELYVRLPLLVEFYRQIFDNGNKEFKSQSVKDQMDEEQVSFVPEIGNVWSGLIINIFDKSRHIENGVYTSDNMRKIVSEVNSIYKHYKGSAPADKLVRHIMIELVSEINRRYGIIKRQELQQYYTVVNATKTNSLSIEESTYSNNDFDILNESMEFEGNAPSEEFIKYKSSIADPATPVETKINRLTDYTILKQFREKVQSAINIEREYALDPAVGNDTVLTLVDRIRMLKQAIARKSSREEKYDMIIKAIEESEAMNQSSNDIFLCFHEFVVTPLRTLFHMNKALESFLYNMLVLISISRESDIGGIKNNTLFESSVRLGSDEKKLHEALKTIALSKAPSLSNAEGLLIFGKVNPVKISIADNLKMDTNEKKAAVTIALMNTLVQFTSNSGDLVKLNISTTNRATIDFSEFQKVCEYLIANVKHMIDKFTGLVPSSLLNKVTKTESGIYSLEKNLMHVVFNKLNKSESQRDVASIDTINKFMPLVSKIIFESSLNTNTLFTNLILQQNAENATPIADALPVIRDSFAEYSKDARMFILPTTAPLTKISNLLFNPKSNSSLINQPKYGIVQEFNILISQYLNHMYDQQSRKIYTKAFATFAGSSLIDALNGQSFPDFGKDDTKMNSHYDAPKSQTILSSTLAYVMKTLSNRVNPTTGMKIHEVGSLQEVSPQILEKYRSVIPMYLRIFKLFLTRCRIYRKMIGRSSISGSLNLQPRIALTSEETKVRENIDDVLISFANPIESVIGSTTNDEAAKDSINLYLDEIINSLTSLVKDVEAVQTELLETDSTVSLYFDMKKDFTKNYFSSAKELPFAPLSVLSMGFTTENGVVPLHSSADHINNKFLYGLRSLLIDDFKISTTKIPYLKSIINDFNGYSTKSNNISESKFNDMLSYVGRAMNYIYDLRFFNGLAISRVDVLGKNNAPVVQDLTTFQEQASKSSAMTIIESVNVIDSKNRVAKFIKDNSGMNIPAATTVNAPANGSNYNPRRRVVMVNIVDLNIMPINVHSLMREIPLANLYNYAMTFDAMVTPDVVGDTLFTELLRKPYSKIDVKPNRNLLQIVYQGVDNPVEQLLRENGLRFVGDVLVKKLMKYNTQDTNRTSQLNLMTGNRLASIQQRVDSKIFHNLLFLTLVQFAIKKKVKSELDFINTRVVSETNAVNDLITNANVHDDSTENLFEF